MSWRGTNLVIWAVFVAVSAPRSGAHPMMAEPVDHPLVPGFDRFHAPEDDEAHIARGGLLLLGELNCVSCHAPPGGWRDRIPPRARVSLAGVGSRLSEDDLWLFVRSPQHRKKGTTMPGLFSGPDRDDVALEGIVRFLGSLKAPPGRHPAGDVERGRVLYHTVGCVACHEPARLEDYRPAEAPAGVDIEEPGLPSVPILFADRYDRDALVEFLLDPLRSRRDGRMPATPLTPQEAADVAAYLQINREPLDVAERVALGIEPPPLEAGREAFVRMNCVACHEAGVEAGAGPRAAGLAALRPDRGCLSAEKKAAVPDYGLSDFQRRALGLALAAIRAEPAPAPRTVLERTDDFLMRMNCYACHEWRGTGGLEEPRAQYFTVNDPTVHSMGEFGRLPPKLDHVGRKLTRGWMEKLLWSGGGAVRGYMTARMPQFGKANAEPVIPLLAAASVRDRPVRIDTSGLLKHHRSELGRVLMSVGPGGLGCVSCHGLKDRRALGVPMIRLTHAVERLQPEYFKELLLNPQATQAGTLMPPLFLGRKKANEEIEAIWTYLKELDQSRLPEGLLQSGDYELKPADGKRPMVFRTFVEGAGMQAVAVGFPEGAHAAFDALEVRWALVWRGRFLDAQSTWEERAMTPAKPLGSDVVSLPSWMPLARTAGAWPEAGGAAAGYGFRGYRVGRDGLPVFLYEVQGMAVEDVLRPGSDGKSWKRTLTVKAGRAEGAAGDGWMFRGLSPGAKPVPLVWKGGVAVIEEELRP